MANIKSQIKRNKTNEKARLRNRAVRSEVRGQIRNVRAAIEAGNADEAQAALQVASRKIDKAVSKGVLHKKNAANRKSRLAKAVNALKA
ncbi:30S ribosomal protein S20 [Brevibacterium ravenspurgense]|uniref:Small ribosomal subunit protein bS20 n=1 Tax=Brevibacterium ravenspurgense TaxID=479117 RepID=A0A150H7E9_9MICO|nr:30S ribosomal protein S20 [Brevibacterium ravenspurgense]KXZ58023.1 30S ribosomal protein S20 [Brevibacterium ravenspurgense]PKY69923.1 30S ribosomal protein S20 [Brevibacterium ravenspurgense]